MKTFVKPSNRAFRKAGALFVLVAFLFNSVLPANAQSVFNLPLPGARVALSPAFNPLLLKAVKVYPDNPFKFDFIVDVGDSNLQGEQLKEESNKLIKYFLASLTTPENDLWVNLSPYEKEKIIPESFGVTEMGRDLLAQDYLLKQITASLIYPEEELGKKFWDKVYAEAQTKYGTSEIPINTFNKVWIVPEKAVVYENGQTAYVTETKLKVMLEEDYLALENNKSNNQLGMDKLEEQDVNALNSISSKVVREIIIPELEKEVNEGKNFAQLRQVYNSLILANWYKRKLKDGILAQVYMDKNKVAGVDIDDKTESKKIWDQYVKAFQKGVYNYIKEDYDPVTQETIPRKYFSGGVQLFALASEATEEHHYEGSTPQAVLSVANPEKILEVGVIVNPHEVEKPMIEAAKDERNQWVAQKLQEWGLVQNDKVLGAMHAGHNAARRLEALRRLLRMKNIDIEQWAKEQAEKMDERDLRNLKEALALIGLNEEQIGAIADKIVLVDVPKGIRLNVNRARIGGIIIRAKDSPKILFPKDRLVASFQNKEFLGDLLHEVIEIQFLEQGVGVDDAHTQAIEARDKFLGKENKLGQEFDTQALKVEAGATKIEGAMHEGTDNALSPSIAEKVKFLAQKALQQRMARDATDDEDLFANPFFNLNDFISPLRESLTVDEIEQVFSMRGSPVFDHLLDMIFENEWNQLKEEIQHLIVVGLLGDFAGKKEVFLQAATNGNSAWDRLARVAQNRVWIKIMDRINEDAYPEEVIKRLQALKIAGMNAEILNENFRFLDQDQMVALLEELIFDTNIIIDSRLVAIFKKVGPTVIRAFKLDENFRTIEDGGFFDTLKSLKKIDDSELDIILKESQADPARILFLAFWGYIPDMKKVDVIFHGSQWDFIEDMIFASNGFIDVGEGGVDRKNGKQRVHNFFSLHAEHSQLFADDGTVLEFDVGKFFKKGIRLKLGASVTEAELIALQPVPLELLTNKSKTELMEKFVSSDKSRNDALAKALGFKSFLAMQKALKDKGGNNSEDKIIGAMHEDMDSAMLSDESGDDAINSRTGTTSIYTIASSSTDSLANQFQKAKQLLAEHGNHGTVLFGYSGREAEVTATDTLETVEMRLNYGSLKKGMIDYYSSKGNVDKLSWSDVSRELIDKGWGKQISLTEIVFTRNLKQEKGVSELLVFLQQIPSPTGFFTADMPHPAEEPKDFFVRLHQEMKEKGLKAKFVAVEGVLVEVNTSVSPEVYYDRWRKEVWNTAKKLAEGLQSFVVGFEEDLGDGVLDNPKEAIDQSIPEEVKVEVQHYIEIQKQKLEVENGTSPVVLNLLDAIPVEYDPINKTIQYVYTAKGDFEAYAWLDHQTVKALDEILEQKYGIDLLTIDEQKQHRMYGIIQAKINVYLATIRYRFQNLGAVKIFHDAGSPSRSEFSANMIERRIKAIQTLLTSISVELDGGLKIDNRPEAIVNAETLSEDIKNWATSNTAQDRGLMYRLNRLRSIREAYPTAMQMLEPYRGQGEGERLSNELIELKKSLDIAYTDVLADVYQSILPQDQDIRDELVSLLLAIEFGTLDEKRVLAWDIAGKIKREESFPSQVFVPHLNWQNADEDAVARFVSGAKRSLKDYITRNVIVNKEKEDRLISEAIDLLVEAFSIRFVDRSADKKALVYSVDTKQSEEIGVSIENVSFEKIAFFRQQYKLDNAQLADINKGGIDLSADQFKMEVQGNGQDINFNFNPAQLENMNIDGFIPIIINIAPVTNLPLFLSGNNSANQQVTMVNK